jgi:small subunit ribosomal protein S2
MIDFRKLVKAGVHFGHQTSRWLPKMSPYIWGVKNNIHLIDVSKTAHQLEKSARFLQEVAAEGKQILWVGTKKAARAIIQDTAIKLDMPYVNHRWVGGTLSNFAQVKKSITRLLHYEDVLEKSEKYPHYTKKELSKVKKNVDRMQNVIGGIRKLTWPIGAIVLVDVNKEHSALKEAVTMGVPVVALVDTNSDPSLVDYVIPANDDAPHSIAILIEYLQAAVEKGKQASATKKSEKLAAKQAAEAAEDAAVEPAIDEDDIEEEDNTTKETKSSRVRAVAKSIKKEAKKEEGDPEVKQKIKKKIAGKNVETTLVARPAKKA